MKTQIVTIDNRQIIVGIDDDGTVAAQLYTPDTPTPPPTGGKTPPAMKDKIAVGNWLVSQGLKRGSPEYDARFKEMAQGLPLEQLTDKIHL